MIALDLVIFPKSLVARAIRIDPQESEDPLKKQCSSLRSLRPVMTRADIQVKVALFSSEIWLL